MYSGTTMPTNAGKRMTNGRTAKEGKGGRRQLHCQLPVDMHLSLAWPYVSKEKAANAQRTNEAN